MAENEIARAYQILGVNNECSLDEIQNMYRDFAKEIHPDKNKSRDSIKTFQEVSQAFRILTEERTKETEIYQLYSIDIKESTSSLTVHLLPKIFLVWIETCQNFYEMQPVAKGAGIQFKCNYQSSVDNIIYGSISLTFYKSTCKLLIQGHSYLLWHAEHYPVICRQADSLFNSDPEKWLNLADSEKVGSKRIIYQNENTGKQNIGKDKTTPPKLGGIGLSSLRSLANSVQKVKKRLLGTTDDVNQDILSTDQDCFNPTFNDFSSKYGISDLECQGDESAKQIADPLELETTITSDKNENVAPEVQQHVACGGARPKERNRKDHKNRSKDKVIDIRCIICMNWSITAEKDQYGSNMYTCEKCRSLPTQVDSIMALLLTISDNQDKYSIRLNELMSIRDENYALKLELDELKSQKDRNSILCPQNVNKSQPEVNVPITSTSVQPTHNETSREGNERTPIHTENKESTLIIGNSMLREVRTRALAPNVRVKTVSGATVNDIERIISSYESGQVTKLYFLVGSKDCTLPGATIERVLFDYRRLINKAKCLTSQITVLGLTPRIDSTKYQTMMDKVNIAP